LSTLIGFAVAPMRLLNGEGICHRAGLRVGWSGRRADSGRAAV